MNLNYHKYYMPAKKLVYSKLVSDNILINYECDKTRFLGYFT